MNTPEAAAYHARRIRELSALDDWAGLVRHWMAHQHNPALAEASAVAHRLADRGEPAGEFLVAFLASVQENPLDPQREAPEELMNVCAREEQATLLLLYLYPRLALCKMASRYAVEHRGRLLAIGLEAAGKACRLATMLEDETAEAFFHIVLARGCQEAQQLEEARRHYDEALRHYRQLEQAQPGVFLPQVATTLNNLGTVLRDLRQLEEARRHYDEALQLHRQAAALNSTASLFEQQRCWSNLATLYLADAPELGWPDRYKVRDALREALLCAEQYRGGFLTPAQRQRAQQESLHIYERLLRTCVDLWDVYRDLVALREAVQTAEGSRARNLMEMLAEETLEPANTPPDLVAEFRVLRKQLRDAQLMLTDEESRPVAPEAEPPSPESGSGTKSGVPARRDADLLRSLERLPRSTERIAFLRQEVDRLKQKQAEPLRRIHQHDADFDPDRPVAAIDFVTAQRLVPDDVPSAIVQYTLTDDRGIALILTKDGVELVPLPRLSHGEALELARKWYDVYYTDRNNFDAAIPSLLESVAERAVQPVVDHLAGRGIERLILSPNRALHLFPLHACRLADGRYLTDAYEVVYTPSLSILHRCARRQRCRRSDLLIVENPTRDLPFTEVEGHQLRKRYPAPHHTRLYGRWATKDDVMKNAGSSHVINYTGHAYFNPMEPLRSALILGDNHDEQQWLTLRDIFCALHLPETWLAVINGCESGMLMPD